MIVEQTAELAALREVVRDFLGAVDPREWVDSVERVDRRLWRRACVELGMAAVDVPEELGGAGIGFAALAAVVEEAGRTLAPLPLLSSVVLAQGLLVLSGDGEAQRAYLPALLCGESIAAVALDGDGGEVTAVCSPQGEWRLSGQRQRVLDGLAADLLLVVARTREGPAVFAVEAAGGGVVRSAQESMDLTRRFARVGFDGAVARMVGTPRSTGEALRQVRQRLAVAVACEQLGGAERVVEMAVAYAGTRVQFGRVIGSFQAIKHRCAELAVEVDECRSAVAHAVWAVQERPEELPLAAAMAGAVCGPVFLRCALENVQVHGGIGFTWEHPAHLYVRRAESDRALYGEARAHREEVLRALGV